MRRLTLTTGTAIRCVVAVLALAAAAHTAVAQTLNAPRIRVAIPDRFPLPDARALIIRYASADKPDVIILDPNQATPEAVAAALSLLHDLYKERPPTPGSYVVATLKGFAPLGRPNPNTLRWLGVQLSALRAQPPSRVGNLGRGRWIELANPRSRS